MRISRVAMPAPSHTLRVVGLPAEFVCEFAALGDCAGPNNGRECWAHHDRHEATLRLLALDD